MPRQQRVRVEVPSGLYGIEHSNRTAEAHWGKNCFNSSFPAAVANYMLAHDIPAVNTPWAANLAQIEQIIVGDAVTHISDYAFAYTSALKKITIGKGVSSLGFRCLYRCGNWDAGEDLEIIVNCAAMPMLGEDVMGFTWDNPQTFLSVPSSQADQWRKALHESRLRIVEQ